MLAAHVARHRDAGRGAEQPVPHSGRRETAVVACDRQVTRGDELTSGGCRDAVRRSDHRHGHRLHGCHEPVANCEQLPLLVERLVEHLLQVVAGRERAPRTFEDDGADLGPRGVPLQLCRELFHQKGRERVELVGTIESQDRGRRRVLDQQVLQRDSHRGPPCALRPTLLRGGSASGSPPSGSPRIRPMCR